MLGKILANRYRIDAELGRGGMGVVYRGYDSFLMRVVAIKVISAAQMDEQARGRLLAEARSAARLNHPNIVTVYDAVEAEGIPFIVMEYVEGGVLSFETPPGISRAIEYILQICSALAQAHASHIIHRDIKADNVLQTASGAIKLSDFGLALNMDASHAIDGDLITGTLAYLAPEIIQGQPASPQSDLYAMGVLFYELLTGRRPFQGENISVLLKEILFAEVVPPDQLNAEISPVLNTLVLQLLSREPAERPRTAQAVAEALRGMTNTATGPQFAAEAQNVAKPGPHHSLPVRLTSFIGREKEVEQIKAWIGSGQRRLVTLSGVGGTGKTSLALRAAAELLELFPDGIWLAELAPVADALLVPGVVAAALHLREEPERPILQVLLDYLRKRRVLIVLDNCEHLVAAAAELAEQLLRSCPSVVILATSREILGVQGETQLHCPPLALPKMDKESLAALGDCESVNEETLKSLPEEVTSRLGIQIEWLAQHIPEHVILAV